MRRDLNKNLNEAFNRVLKEEASKGKQETTTTQKSNRSWTRTNIRTSARFYA